MTDTEIKNIIDAAPQNIKDSFDKYQRLNDNIVDFVAATGAVGKEHAETLKGMAYIPFNRKIVDDVENQAYIGFTWSSKFIESLNNPQAFADELVGGTIKIDADPIGMIRKNLEGLIRVGLSNNALKTVATTLDALNDQVGISKYGGKITNAKEAEGGSVMVYREGDKEVKYKIRDNDLWVAITSMNKTQVSAFINFLAKPSAILRNGITHSPAFMIANLLRGHIDAYVKYGVPPIRSFITTLKYTIDVYRNTDEVMAFKANTGQGGFSYGQRGKSVLEEQSGFTRKMKRKLRKEARLQGDYAGGATRGFLDGLEGIWDGLTRLGEATELGQRLTVSKHLQGRGVPKLEADYQGMNLINYSRRGAGGGFLPMTLLNMIPLIPFLNARVQGLYRLFENDQSNKNISVAHGIMVRGALLTAIHSAIYAAFSGDDRWEGEGLERKINYDILYFGEQTVYLPRSFEIGAVFGAMPILFFDAIRKQETKDLSNGIISILANTFQFNPTPQVMKPIWEAFSNKDMFLDRPIENAAMADLAPGLRYGPRTTDTMKMLGEQFGVSPVMLEHLAQGYGGSMSMMLLAFTDSILETTGAVPNKPSGLFGDAGLIGGKTWLGQIGGLSRFIRADDERGTRFAQDFYEAKESVTELQQTIRVLRERGRAKEALKLLENNRGKIALRRRIERTSRQLSQINKRINKVREDPNMSPDRKRQLMREHRKRKTELMRTMAKASNEALFN
jgi:hypothetical protein